MLDPVSAVFQPTPTALCQCTPLAGPPPPRRCLKMATLSHVVKEGKTRIRVNVTQFDVNNHYCINVKHPFSF